MIKFLKIGDVRQYYVSVNQDNKFYDVSLDHLYHLLICWIYSTIWENIKSQYNSISLDKRTSGVGAYYSLCPKNKSAYRTILKSNFLVYQIYRKTPLFVTNIYDTKFLSLYAPWNIFS